MLRNRSTLILSMLALVLVLMTACGAPPTSVQPTAVPPTAALVAPTPPLTLTPVLTDTPIPTPSLTPTASATPIPSATPIAGISEPVTVNDVGMQVSSAVFGADMPSSMIGQELAAGYVLLAVDMEFSGEVDLSELPERAGMRQIVVVDEEGEEYPFVYVNLTFSDKPPYKSTLYFAIKEDRQSFSLRLINEELIDLTPVLVKK